MKAKLLIAVLLLPCGLFAASDTVSANFRVIGPGLPPAELGFTSKGKPVTVQLLPDNRSPIQSYNGPAAVIFQEPAPGTRKFTAELPDNTKDLLLLVFSVTPAGQTGVQILKEDLASFPMGSRLFLNICAFPLSLHIGKEEFSIPPGGLKLLPASAGGPKTSFVQILREEASGKVPVFSNNWANSPGLRTLVVLSTDPAQPDRVNVARLPEAAPVTK